MSVGKVWLVGAGPGDPGLITLRGRELIDEADVVVFDKLVGEGVLSLIPERAEKINVGKEGGRHPVPQKEIENILVREALAGKNTLRLKGGDPFVFGRGGEEIEALLEHGIEFEVVPGITSAVAAPSAAGIPVTHRGLAASLHIITAHTKDGGIADTDYAALASLGGTLIFLMGAASVPEICKALTEHGMAKDTPAAAVESGTTSRQRRIEGTLGTFEKLCAREKLHAPAIIMVGDVAALGGKFEWKKFLPLAGKKVIITRPRERAGKLSKMLRDKGAEVIEFPCISTETVHSPLPKLGGWDWIGFTSVTGVDSFFELLREEKKDIRSIGKAKIAAIGRTTADALEARGLFVDFIPDVYDGISLAQGLLEKGSGEKILLFRAEEGSPELTNCLIKAGVDFKEHTLYRTHYETSFFTPTEADAVLFTSASSVRGFKQACPDTYPKHTCCIGRQTAEEAAKLGYPNIKTAEKATIEKLVNTLEEI